MKKWTTCQVLLWKWKITQTRENSSQLADSGKSKKDCIYFQQTAGMAVNYEQVAMSNNYVCKMSHEQLWPLNHDAYEALKV